jgi:hypothetical protein
MVVGCSGGATTRTGRTISRTLRAATWRSPSRTCAWRSRRFGTLLTPAPRTARLGLCLGRTQTHATLVVRTTLSMAARPSPARCRSAPPRAPCSCRTAGAGTPPPPTRPTHQGPLSSRGIAPGGSRRSSPAGNSASAAATTVSRKKEAKLAQKLGRLQPFTVVFSQECMGQLEYFGPT